MRALQVSQGELGLALGRDFAHQLNSAIARLALRGSVRVLDADNRFAFHDLTREIVRQAGGQRKSLTAVLQRIQIARAFTAYQTITLLQTTAATDAPCVVVDLLATLQDEGISAVEAFRLLDQATTELRRLSAHAPVLVSTRASLLPERAGLLARLVDAADTVFVPAEPDLSQHAHQLTFF